MSDTREQVRERIEMKRFRAEVKAEAAEPGATVGEFDARVAAFGNVDSQGDRIEDGAFDATKAAWQESGDPVPVIWSHQWDDPMAHIGSVRPEDLSVDESGLNVHGTIDLSTDLAKQVHRLMVDRRVKEFSFAYLPTESEPDGDVRVLKQLDLIELGPTLKGANAETELFGAKSAISSHESGASDESWDAAAAVAALPESAAALRAAHAWVDSEGDPDAKASYKFPHHEVGPDGTVGAANMTGCSAGIAVLNGGRGGSSIPDGDREGVHAHLGRHLADDDRDVPDLAAAEPDEGKESEPPAGSDEDGPVDPPAEDEQEKGGDAETKYGRVLSKANEGKLREAGDLIGAVLASLGESAADDEADGPRSDDGDGKRSADRDGAGYIDRADAAIRVLDLEGLP